MRVLELGWAAGSEGILLGAFYVFLFKGLASKGQSESPKLATKIVAFTAEYGAPCGPGVRIIMYFKPLVSAYRRDRLCTWHIHKTFVSCVFAHQFDYLHYDSMMASQRLFHSQRRLQSPVLPWDSSLKRRAFNSSSRS